MLKQYIPNWESVVNSYVQGVQPIHIALNLGTSVVDLFRVPLTEYYNGNNEIAVQAMHDGVRTVTVELLQLGTRTSVLTHKLLASADRLLQSRDEKQRERQKPKKSMYSDQPGTIGAGVQQSLKHLGRGVAGGVKAIAREPARAYKRGGTRSLLLAAARGIPRALIIQPAMGITAAFARITQSATNSVDPSKKARSDEKYK